MSGRARTNERTSLSAVTLSCERSIDETATSATLDVYGSDMCGAGSRASTVMSNYARNHEMATFL